ncbi:Exonuclease mut-7 [Blyttiomyces sp. JEL0837]|nr:Exonuclease mut-7 [Blyttiomyces sp. JEL0837]
MSTFLPTADAREKLSTLNLRCFLIDLHQTLSIKPSSSSSSSSKSSAELDLPQQLDKLLPRFKTDFLPHDNDPILNILDMCKMIVIKESDSVPSTNLHNAGPSNQPHPATNQGQSTGGDIEMKNASAVDGNEPVSMTLPQARKVFKCLGRFCLQLLGQESKDGWSIQQAFINTSPQKGKRKRSDDELEPGEYVASDSDTTDVLGNPETHHDTPNPKKPKLDASSTLDSPSSHMSEPNSPVTPITTDPSSPTENAEPTSTTAATNSEVTPPSALEPASSSLPADHEPTSLTSTTNQEATSTTNKETTSTTTTQETTPTKPTPTTATTAQQTAPKPTLPPMPKYQKQAYNLLKDASTSPLFIYVATNLIDITKTYWLTSQPTYANFATEVVSNLLATKSSTELSYLYQKHPLLIFTIDSKITVKVMLEVLLSGDYQATLEIGDVLIKNGLKSICEDVIYKIHIELEKMLRDDPWNQHAIVTNGGGASTINDRKRLGIFTKQAPRLCNTWKIKMSHYKAIVVSARMQSLGWLIGQINSYFTIRYQRYRQQNPSLVTYDMNGIFDEIITEDVGDERGFAGPLGLIDGVLKCEHSYHRAFVVRILEGLEESDILNRVGQLVSERYHVKEDWERVLADRKAAEVEAEGDGMKTAIRKLKKEFKMGTEDSQPLGFYTSNREIVFVNTPEGVTEMGQKILQPGMIVAADCEWRPEDLQVDVSGGGGISPVQIALLQLAVMSSDPESTFEPKVYLVDFTKLYPHVLGPVLKPLFARRDITKIGFNFSQDYKKIRKRIPKMESGVCNLIDFEKDILNLVDEEGREYGKKRRVSLSDLCRIFLGRGIDKIERISDWERRPLSARQMRYAANDVLVLLDIYKAVGAERLRVKGPRNTKKKDKKKKKKDGKDQNNEKVNKKAKK